MRRFALIDPLFAGARNPMEERDYGSWVSYEEAVSNFEKCKRIESERCIDIFEQYFEPFLIARGLEDQLKKCRNEIRNLQYEP